MSLRWYQKEAVDATWLSCKAGNNPLICMPTGSGKSWVIAELARQVRELWNGRVLMLAHRSELIEQNAEKMQILLPNEPTGVNSAGLNKRDVRNNVLCAGIQSVWKSSDKIGERNIIIVDEAHLIPNDNKGMYRRFLSELAQTSPKHKVIGLSATPYRLKGGELTDGDIFDEICYNTPIDPLIKEGFLCPLTMPDKIESEIDTRQLNVRGGEFVLRQMQDVYAETTRVDKACNELIALSEDRQSIIVFCAGVHHAEMVQEHIEKATGQDVGLLTGETLPLERGSMINRFKSGNLRWLVNVDVLTTGFDATLIDCVAILRSTMSAGLLAQMAGRGFRVDPRKKDCLILDFGQNFKRHGALNDPDYGRRKKRTKKKASGAPFKRCPQCDAENPTSVVYCMSCSFEFPFEEKPKHDESADTESEAVKSDEPEPPKKQHVHEVYCFRHVSKKSGSESFRIDYCRAVGRPISEYVCIEHEGFARRKAEETWAQHSIAPCPATIDEALRLWDCGALRMPVHIWWQLDKRFPKVVEKEFEEDCPDTWLDEPPGDMFLEEDEIPF